MASRDRHSPVASLASLEFLQTQRRGSITDPSLHKIHNSYRHHPEGDSANNKYMSDHRPTSPYVFGDATVEPSSHLRKLLHSPSAEHISHRSTPPMSHDSQEPPRNHSGTPQIYLRTLDITPVIGLNLASKESNHMNVDNDRHSFINRRGIRDPPAFDFNMRRHSIAVGANPINLPNLSSTLHGTKRKMSGDRNIFPPVGEDTDPQLVGPGVPSVMDLDPDAPAPKRRGSTIDTHRIAQLSLNDRRNSVDSRGHQWLSNDRRESAPSLFPNVPGISSFNTGPNHPESHHSRAPSSLSSFSWPESSQVVEPSNSNLVQNESPPTQNGRTFDPVHQTNLMPPINYPPDRRMSVPDNLTHPSSSRTLRSRSRPPSRQNTDHSGPSSGQEEPSGASSPGIKHGKDTGMTPYSRSPELRVSHKLAERKRRKEMKDLFDELRDQLPADRGMKASKWEILSKAIDFVVQLKRSHQELAQEVEILRQQVHGQPRSEAMPGFTPGASHLHNGYGQIPPIMAAFPSPLVQPHQPSQNQSSHQESRPNSTQDMFPPPHSSSQSVNGHRLDPHPT
ncbi:hypothetical protein M413DRAFT_441255 [Hebeloma cylindrosporum]|uniref:BHLH domain-containing protein n=1 Tax=Hebeloma cylindrosporum TaxID=76867 RepID=A0A0C3CQ25_HEBCY|nr:hypothetical protein M413DRAFT_441255 [Hebeloma cylindrosporum h7]